MQNLRNKTFLSNIENAKLLARATREKVKDLRLEDGLQGKSETQQYQES